MSSTGWFKYAEVPFAVEFKHTLEYQCGSPHSGRAVHNTVMAVLHSMYDKSEYRSYGAYGLIVGPGIEFWFQDDFTLNFVSKDDAMMFKLAFESPT